MAANQYMMYPMANGHWAVLQYSGNYSTEIAIISSEDNDRIRRMGEAEKSDFIKKKKVIDIHYPQAGYWPDWAAFYKDTPHTKSGVIFQQSGESQYTFIDCNKINFNDIFKYVKLITPGNARLLPYWGLDINHPAGRQLELKSETEVYSIESKFQTIRKTIPDCVITVKKGRKKKTPLQLKIIASI